MSKKHRKSGNSGMMSSPAPASSGAGLSHAAEYRTIKFDLLKVLILNAVYLAVILFLYYSNQKNQFLDHWFARVLHF